MQSILFTAFTMFSEVDVILFLIEATSDEIGRGDRRILDKIIESKKPCILVINKIDSATGEKLEGASFDIYVNKKERKFRSTLCYLQLSSSR